MGGLFTSFNTGVAGLTAAQAALNATSHNVTNVDTKGYTRQQVVLVDKDYLPVNTQSGVKEYGLGSLIEQIRTIRDKFLDTAYRRQYGRQGFYDAETYAIEEVENLFGELEGSTFQADMESLWTSVQELKKEPESIVSRTDFVQTAKSFMDRCEDIYKQLTKYQKDMNTKVKSSVERINEIGNEIFKLNKEIRKDESNGQRANDYRDQRDKLIDELGNLADISVRHFNDGTCSINLEGTAFVTEFGAEEIKLATVEDLAKKRGDKVDDNCRDLYIPTWADGTEVFNTDIKISTKRDNDIGYVKGLLLSRGRSSGRYTNIPVEPDINDYRTTETGDLKSANDIKDDTMRNAYNAALSKYNIEKDKYNDITKASVIINAQAEFDQLIHGMATITNDILSPNLTASFVLTGKIDTEGNFTEGKIGDDGTTFNEVDKDKIGATSGIITWRDGDGYICNVQKDGKTPAADTTDSNGKTVKWADAHGNLIWRDEKGNDVTELVDKDHKKSDLILKNELSASKMLGFSDPDHKSIDGTTPRDFVKKTAMGEGNRGYEKCEFKMLDLVAAPISLDSSKVQGHALYNRKSVDRYCDKADGGAVDASDVKGAGTYLRLYNYENPDDAYTMFTIGEEEVNRSVKDAVSLLPISYVTDTGDYSAKTADKLADVWHEKFATVNPNSLTKYDFADYYSAYMSDIANTGQTYKALQKSQEVTVNSVENQRQQVVGVNADEELTFLIKYQQAFNANSRYITVINSMLETLLTSMT